jgi:hypothetical protein
VRGGPPLLTFFHVTQNFNIIYLMMDMPFLGSRGLQSNISRRGQRHWGRCLTLPFMLG